MGNAIDPRPYILQCALEMTSVPHTGEKVEVQVNGHTISVYSHHRRLAKRGGLGDVVTAIAIALHEKGVNVGVALPHWNRIFEPEPAEEVEGEYVQLEQAGISHFDDHLFLIDDPVFSPQAPCVIFMARSAIGKACATKSMFSMTFCPC